MQAELLIAILAGLGGLLGWVLADFFAKKTIGAVGDVVTLVWAHIFGTIILSTLLVYQFFTTGALPVPTSVLNWILLLFFGALQAAVYLFVYRGFAKGQVAVLNPIFASYSGLVVLGSVFVFGEVLHTNGLLVIVLIFIGVFLLSLDGGALSTGRFSLTTPGVREVLIATAFATLWTLYWDVFVGGNDWITYTFYMYAWMTLVMYLIAIAQKVNLSAVREKPYVWKFLVLIGACEIIAYLAISYGYSATSMTSIIAIISGAFSVPVIILARLFLKERPTMMQTIGSILVILGVALLPMF